MLINLNTAGSPAHALQGIALQSDSDYSIVKSCLPYLSRRLLTDDDPRARAALKELLFAGGEHISLERVELLMQGVQDFTVDGLAGSSTNSTSSSGSSSAAVVPAQAQQRAPASAPAPLINSTAKEVLAAVFSARPTYVQQLLVNEAVGTVDAAGRQLAAAVLSPALANLAAAQAAVPQVGGGGSGAGPLGSVPLPAPLALLTRLPSLVELSPEDQQQLRTAQGITSLLLQQQALQPGGSMGPAGTRLTPQQAAALAQQLASELGPLLPQLLPGIAATGQMFAQELVKRNTDRLAAVVAGSRGSAEDPNYTPPMDL